MTQEKKMQLTLGPLLYFWPLEDVKAFYRQACSWPVDVVYLGETVCSRRREMSLDAWLAVAEQLHEAGKQVVLSTQTLLESAADRRQLMQLVARAQQHPAIACVEASDMSGVEVCAQLGMPFVAGAALNIYSPAALKVLLRQGLKRWVFPVELSRQTLAEMQAWIHDHQPEVETEVFSYGKLPLAWSARCFTARHHNLPKDRCQFVCRDYPAGLMLRSQEAQELFTLNGIQTLSAAPFNLLYQGDDLKDLAVTHLRISPEAQPMQEVIQAFDRMRQGEGVENVLHLVDQASCNGYWFGEPGQQRIT